MDEPSTIQLAGGIALSVVFGSFYAATAAALSALGEAQLAAREEAGGPEAALARRALEHSHTIRARLVLGRGLFFGLCVGLASTLGASSGTGALVGWALTGALGYAMVSEAVAGIARRRAGSVALRLLRWMRPAELLMAPLAVPVVLVGTLATRFLREPEARAELDHFAVEHMIEKGEERGAIEGEHAEMLRSVLDFRDTVAREVMVPRRKVVAFDIGAGLDEVLRQIESSGHSRYPVYRGSLDHVEGILYAKDLFRVLQQQAGKPVALAQLLRKPVLFSAETQLIGDVLRQMQQRRFHLVVVVDEFGGTGGILTLEDIIEEIVGEIHDEHDGHATPVVERAPGRWLVDATLSLWDLSELVDLEVVADPGSAEADSLGGLVVDLVGRVPEVGTEVVSGQALLRVVEADSRQVRRIEISRIPTEAHVES